MTDVQSPGSAEPAKVRSTSAQQMRSWTGPAVLSFGFRPFFLGAGLWAALSMALWLSFLTGGYTLPTSFDPVSWHAHEFLFGYLGAVVAGFLLTAVPNWTGRLPIVGWPLGGLFALWLAGRVAVAVSAALPPFFVALADLAMPVALAWTIAREIVAGRNWKNLIVLGLLGILLTGNAVFHWEAAHGEVAARGYGLRIGLATALMLIAVIGGRIVPSFTRNWLVRQGAGTLPAPPMGRFDRVALLVLLVSLVMWVVAPASKMTGAGIAVAGVLHVARLTRWAGHRTMTEPLVLVLHAGYAFLPAGALVLAAGNLWAGGGGQGSALHLWLAGAIGLMTLAVMTRATLGHTGQALKAGPATMLIYAAAVLAAIARSLAGLWPEQAAALETIAAGSWILAYAAFVVVYGPLLVRARQDR